MFRLQKTVRTKGEYYRSMAEHLEKLSQGIGSGELAAAIRVLNDIILTARKARLTKSQYNMFLLSDIMTWCEVGNALCIKASANESGKRSPEFMNATSRLFVREVVEKVIVNGLKIARGGDTILEDIAQEINDLNMTDLMDGILKDMDTVAHELVK